MNILYLTPNFGTGGTEKMVLELALNMQDGGFRSMVCSIHDGVLGTELAKRGIRYEFFIGTNRRGSSVFRKFGFLSRVIRLRGLIAAEGIDAVHAHHQSALHLALLATRWTPVKVVYTEHTRPDIIYPPAVLRKGGALARRADRCTGVSSEITEYFTAEMGVCPDKVSTILNGIDIERFSGATAGDARSELGFSPTDPVVGCIGNLRQEKNQQQLVEAFRFVVSVHPTARLVLVGGGAYHDRLAAMVSEFGLDNNVFLLGPRLDTPNLLAMMDVYCLASTFEGLPLSILEAMASGTPVIGTDVIGIRDVVLHGENGLLVPLNDPWRTADAILQLIADREYAKQLALKGSELVVENYSLGSMIRAYRNLYTELV